jgi:Restriction endonuclease
LGDLVDSLHDNLSAEEFERLLYVLLEKMGFDQVIHTGGSGDGGIDLRAIWTQSQVPGLEVDLNFVIQAKRFGPSTSLNPRFVRELKGTLDPGQWGLIITTAKATPQTRQIGLRDPSRIVSIIDGRQLVALCKKYGVAFRAEYLFDKSFLKPEEEPSGPPDPTRPPTSENAPSDLVGLLSSSLGGRFSRVGNSPIYKGDSLVLVARWSQRYPRKGQNYWFKLTQRDISAIDEFGVSHFAYVCDGNGTVLIPKSLMMERVNGGRLGRTPKEGDLQHYHMAFTDNGGKHAWILRGGLKEDVQELFHATRP